MKRMVHYLIKFPCRSVRYGAIRYGAREVTRGIYFISLYNQIKKIEDRVRIFGADGSCLILTTVYSRFSEYAWRCMEVLRRRKRSTKGEMETLDGIGRESCISYGAIDLGRMISITNFINLNANNSYRM